MNVLKLVSGLFGATLLLCLDFYHKWSIWGTFPKIVWLIIGFGLLLFSVYAPAITGRMQHFYVEVAVMFYLVALIIILPYLGGHSSVGFSANEPVLWIVILLTVWQLNSYRKRIAKQTKEEQKK